VITFSTVNWIVSRRDRLRTSRIIVLGLGRMVGVGLSTSATRVLRLPAMDCTGSTVRCMDVYILYMTTTMKMAGMAIMTRMPMMRVQLFELSINWIIL